MPRKRKKERKQERQEKETISWLLEAAILDKVIGAYPMFYRSTSTKRSPKPGMVFLRMYMANNIDDFFHTSVIIEISPKKLLRLI